MGPPCMVSHSSFACHGVSLTNYNVSDLIVGLERTRMAASLRIFSCLQSVHSHDAVALMPFSCKA